MASNKGIFVSYRRDETTANAGWLADKLGDQFGQQNVFRDIGSIEPGVDFVEAIERALQSCGVMLVIIGRGWAPALKEHEQSGQEDYTRLEVATALERNVRVIPVLVQGASMPRAEELPDDLNPLRRRHSIELHDTNWKSDVAHLIGVLDKIPDISKDRTAETSFEIEFPINQIPARDIGRLVVGSSKPSKVKAREKLLEDMTIEVFLDGKAMLPLQPGRGFSLTIEAGLHQLEVRGSYLGQERQTASLTVGVSSGEVLRLLCGFTQNERLFIRHR